MTQIAHPDHYNWLPDIECIDVIKHFDFILGSVIKYAWRAGRKESETKLDDLKKMAYYASLAVKLEIKRMGQGKTACPVCNTEVENDQWGLEDGEYGHHRCPHCSNRITVSRTLEEGEYYIEAGWI
jgi:DNA-directed RNA polymerase subunit RPC12/RpoP